MLESDRGGVVPIRGLKRNERTDDLTRSSERNKGICLTRSLTKNKTFCNGFDTTGLLISGDLYADSKQGVWSDLSEEVASNLSKSVVSLSLVDGQSVLFACSGIVVRRVKHVTRFLTSANFVEALNEKRKDHDNLKIQVRHGDNAEIGVLGEYDLDHNIANVHAMNIPDLQPVVFNNLMELPPLTEVAFVGMDVSGKLVGTSGILNDNPSGSEYSGKLTLSKFSKVCDGGPLFGFDGKFVGMNLILGTERTFFLSTYRALMWLGQCTLLDKIKLSPRLNSNQSHGDACSCNKDRFEDLKSLRYPPLPKSRSNDCMILVNNFEDHFGDEYGKGVWSELSETVSSNIYENTVALASFNEEKRFFACTGFFIKWNGGSIILTSASLIRRSHDLYNIVENLRIEVLRPNGQHAEGELQHYNLHYNVALVSVKDFCPGEPATIQHMWYKNCWHWRAPSSV